MKNNWFSDKKKQKLIILFLSFLCVFLPIITLISIKLSLLPEIYETYPNPSENVSPPASVSPSPPASVSPTESMNIKVNLQALASNNQNQKVEIFVPGTNFRKNVLLNTDGTGVLDLTGLNQTNTYDFFLWAHPYLIKKVAGVNLNNKPNPLVFDPMLIGDLNTDNQVNSLDWSWMVLNFGKNGDIFNQ
jgi:hypothetical protein